MWHIKETLDASTSVGAGRHTADRVVLVTTQIGCVGRAGWDGKMTPQRHEAGRTYPHVMKHYSVENHVFSIFAMMKAGVGKTTPITFNLS